MKKVIWIAVFLTGLIGMASAQYTEKPAQNTNGHKFDKSKLFFGGNLALSFGTYTVINVSPQIGYHFSPQFAAGAGISYIYYNYKYYNYGYKTQDIQSYAGFNLFGRFYPIRQFFIQAQPELDYVWGKEKFYGGNYYEDKIPSQFVPCLLLGGGAAIPAGPGALTFSVLYDVVQNTWSPYYHQAVYGVGFNMGF